jgi:hypothetical protein
MSKSSGGSPFIIIFVTYIPIIPDMPYPQPPFRTISFRQFRDLLSGKGIILKGVCTHLRRPVFKGRRYHGIIFHSVFPEALSKSFSISPLSGTRQALFQREKIRSYFRNITVSFNAMGFYPVTFHLPPLTIPYRVRAGIIATGKENLLFFHPK